MNGNKLSDSATNAAKLEQYYLDYKANKEKEALNKLGLPIFMKSPERKAKPKEELILPSDRKPLPGLKKNYPLDILLRQLPEGIRKSREVRLEEEKSGRDISSNYIKDSISSALGAPVDLANTLLSLLGIEVEQKPFLGSKYIREAYDKPPYRYPIKPKAKY
jgi:hypothetical protein